MQKERKFSLRKTLYGINPLLRATRTLVKVIQFLDDPKLFCYILHLIQFGLLARFVQFESDGQIIILFLCDCYPS